jgi:hypothetical protein
MTLELSDVMSSVYDCEDNSSVSSDWDGGWRVTIGGSRHAGWEAEAYVESIDQATRWLHERALERCPDYKDRYANRVTTRTGSSA